ncbi:MAG: gallidermin family lantibiotic [Deltaproteobacteria bacterium]|nr:gallidermin family lantibiotic [Candidatus Tharpella sp.]
MFSLGGWYCSGRSRPLCCPGCSRTGLFNAA